jgi:hypothetical protein
LHGSEKDGNLREIFTDIGKKMAMGKLEVLPLTVKK